MTFTFYYSEAVLRDSLISKCSNEEMLCIIEQVVQECIQDLTVNSIQTKRAERKLSLAKLGNEARITKLKHFWCR